MSKMGSAETNVWKNAHEFNIGSYHGNVVALKKIYKKTISLNRETQMELKTV